MNFLETDIEGIVLIDPERLEDERGFFARTYCRREFEERGLDPALAQCSISFNRERGTLRGMHYQSAPHEESKLVRCTQGAVYDVVVDLRRGSPTFKRWLGVELSASNRRMIYIGGGLAHGFLTLTPDAELFYQISDFYRPEAAHGVRWDDAAFAIDWPAEPSVISERDRNLPDFEA
ncbi:MAG: dTDP-4-dehydrorhamnose 3,5-epimerase [Myxococcales bacterium]|nr:dTDP-4-dehydrorhamnose 3,5-epimerase [Myxococcales bacterium]